MSRLDECITLDLPRIRDPRGNLTFIEGDNHLPFAVRRAYWIYDVPGGESGGGHAYRTLDEFVVALSGSFEVEIDDGSERRIVHLNRSYHGLLIRHGIWRSLTRFSTNAVALLLVSAAYDESDYIRNYDEYARFRHQRDR